MASASGHSLASPVLGERTGEDYRFPSAASTAAAAAAVGNADGEGGGGGPAASPPNMEAFRSIPRFSRKEPMAVFMPPERVRELQLSPVFLSFLAGCLRYNTEKRMTAKDMLQHPFLQVRR